MKLLDIGDWIALVVGVVAILSSVIVPYFTARMNRRVTLEQQSRELFFHAKLAAYNELIDILAWTDARSSDMAEMRKLLSALSQAQIFADDITSELIRQYNRDWTTAYFAIREITLHKGITGQVDETYRDLLQSMRREMSAYSPPRRKFLFHSHF